MIKFFIGLLILTCSLSNASRIRSSQALNMSRVNASLDSDSSSALNSSSMLNNTYSRITPENSVILLVDHQVGLLNGVRTSNLDELKKAIIFLAQQAKLFKIPVVITTSADNGPNGPLMKEIREILPDAKVIRRPGQINAWDNSEFRNAVTSLNRKKLLIAGISTDVCLTFVALSAMQSGFEAYAVLDASGTWSPIVLAAAVMRMQKHGVEMINTFAISGELQVDWRNATGVEYANILSENLPFYANLITANNATHMQSNVTNTTTS